MSESEAATFPPGFPRAAVATEVVFKVSFMETCFHSNSWAHQQRTLCSSTRAIHSRLETDKGVFVLQVSDRKSVDSCFRIKVCGEQSFQRKGLFISHLTHDQICAFLA